MTLFQVKINGRARTKKNSKQIFRGKNGRPFITSSNQFKQWAIYAGLFIRRANNLISPIDKPCNLTVKCYYKNHQHEQDLENVIASIADVLEDNGVIKNDKLFYSYDNSRKIFDSESEYLEIIISDFQD